MDAMDVSLLESALRYAKRGVPVFPADRQTKAPLTPNGFKDATTDEHQIREWWTRFPNANIAVPTGKRVGLMVVDIDAKNGGLQSLARLVDQNGPLDSPVTKTGGGGFHYWFAYDERFRISQNREAGIDVRSEGGYVVVAPSLHASGVRYEGEVPDSAESIPAWLSETLLTLARKAIKTGLNDEPIKEGGRNDELFRIGVKVRKQGWDDESVRSHLLLINERRCVPPLDDQEIGSVIESVLSRVEIGEAAKVEAEMRQRFKKPKPVEETEDEVNAALDELERAEPKKPKKDKKKSAEDELLEQLAEEELARQKMAQAELEAHLAVLDARCATMSYADVRTLLTKHVYLPQPVLYDEIILLSNQSRLQDILPRDSVIFVAVLGEYSSAKSYVTHIATFLAGGRFILDPTEAAVNGELIKTPKVTLGIDEVDELIKKYPHIATLLRMGNTWEATKPYRVPNGEGGWENVDVNIGGPKFFNGYDSVDPALLSRCLKMDMERRKDVAMIVKKMQGFPELEIAQRWLELRCEAALKMWTAVKVTALMNSADFQKEVELLTMKMTIPRNVEIVIGILLLGRILDIDTSGIVSNYLNAEVRLSQKSEVYKDVLLECYKQLLKTTVEKEETELDVRSRWSEKHELEVNSTELYALMNERLFAKARESIGTGQWRHVLIDLGFSRSKNWFKETRRNAWRQKYYLVFDAELLENIGYTAFKEPATEPATGGKGAEPEGGSQIPPVGSVGGSVGSVGSATGSVDAAPSLPDKIDTLHMERPKSGGNGPTRPSLKPTEATEPTSPGCRDCVDEKGDCPGCAEGKGCRECTRIILRRQK
jgi:hypothetical protein